MYIVLLRSRILYNSRFTLIATSLGSNVVETRVHCDMKCSDDLPYTRYLIRAFFCPLKAIVGSAMVIRDHMGQNSVWWDYRILCNENIRSFCSTESSFSYNKCPRISNILFHTFLPKFCFFFSCLLKILSKMANGVDPDQTNPSGAV